MTRRSDRKGAVYVTLREGEVAVTLPMVGTAGNANVDYDKDNRVLGIEMLDATKVTVNGMTFEVSGMTDEEAEREEELAREVWQDK